MLKNDILNVFNFQQRCCLHIVITTDVKEWNTISAGTWRTVHEHIVADTFHSKESSSALTVHEQQASQKSWLSSFHSTACGDYKKYIYDNTSCHLRYWNLKALHYTDENVMWRKQEDEIQNSISYIKT